MRLRPNKRFQATALALRARPAPEPRRWASNMIRTALLSAFLVTITGCASSGPIAPPVTPGQSFSGSYLNIEAPNSEGWHLMQNSAAGIAFSTGDPTDSVVANVARFGLPPTATPDDFVAYIRAGVEKDTDPARFEIMRSDFTYTNVRGYPCVRFDGLSQDKKPHGSSTPLLLELVSLYCRHPVRQDSGFMASYSHRGKEHRPTFESEAERFFQGVQVRDH